jgi:hypothetical protein
MTRGMKERKTIKTKPLTPTQRALVAAYLKTQFPWLGTNREVSGADVVEQLADIYRELKRK